MGTRQTRRLHDSNKRLSDMSVLRGFPPKVIWIRLGNCTTQQIEDLLSEKPRGSGWIRERSNGRATILILTFNMDSSARLRSSFFGRSSRCKSGGMPYKFLSHPGAADLWEYPVTNFPRSCPLTPPEISS